MQYPYKWCLFQGDRFVNNTLRLKTNKKNQLDQKLINQFRVKSSSLTMIPSQSIPADSECRVMS